jgi:hypothetical protein
MTRTHSPLFVNCECVKFIVVFKVCIITVAHILPIDCFDLQLLEDTAPQTLPLSDWISWKVTKHCRAACVRMRSATAAAATAASASLSTPRYKKTQPTTPSAATSWLERAQQLGCWCAAERSSMLHWPDVDALRPFRNERNSYFSDAGDDVDQEADPYFL